MDLYILTIIGIAVSVALYYFGYRQTIGARKEKIRSANSEIEKTLLKRIVLESYQPSVRDISRLIETKARDYNLRTADLHSDIQVLNTLFTRIIETDFISPDKRNEILEKISPVFLQAEEKPVEETTMVELASMRRTQRVRMSLSLLMAVIASLLGAFSVFWYSLLESQELMILAIVGTVAASFVVIIFVSYIYRFRESQEEATAYSALQSAADFEREIGRALKKAGVKLLQAEANRGYDFLAEIHDKKVIIEVKTWSHRVPLGLVRRVIDQLNNAVWAEQADEAIIVTKAPVEITPGIIDTKNVRIMSLKELRNYLIHGE